MIKITVPGEPIGKHRPRFARRGKIVVAYSDQRTEEGKFIAQVLEQTNGQKLEGPLRFSMYCYKSRPKSHYGTGRNAGIIKASAPRYLTSTPDLDNIIKYALDCLNGILFKDDSQIVRISASKEYGENPRVEMILTEVTA